MSKHRHQTHQQPQPPAPVSFFGECNACRFYKHDGHGMARCHARPPQLRVPYDNLSAWPVVPQVGGGCGLFNPKTQ
jgi:hypothetical protein